MKNPETTSFSIVPIVGRPPSYRIYSMNNQSNTRSLFGQLSYQWCGLNDYLFTITIGDSVYRVRSSDLKFRRLVLVDTSDIDQSSRFLCSKSLFQVNNTFSRSTTKYHVTIDDTQSTYGYLIIVMLLHLHECER